MGLTHFPFGVSSFGIPLVGSGPILTTGNIFFVDSNSSYRADSAGNGRDPNSPLATLDYAIGLCTANKGDHILLMPNHAESITGASIITCDVAGVTIIGLGSGYNNRPNFLYGAATTTIVVSAADVVIQNIVLAAGAADVVTGIGVTGVGFKMIDCEFVDSAADLNFLSPVTATGADGTADGMRLINNRATSADAATLAFLKTIGDVTDLVMIGNVSVSEGTGLATMVTCATGKDLKKCFIAWNFLSSKATAGNLFISNDTASPNNSGIIAHNRCGHADVTTGHILGVVGGCRMFDNLSVSTDALSGFVIPAIDVDS